MWVCSKHGAFPSSCPFCAHEKTKTPRRTENMNRTNIEERLERLRHEQANLEAELARVDKFETDPFNDGDIFEFYFQFSSHGRVYTYVFLKQDGMFYGTGPRLREPLTWRALVDIYLSKKAWDIRRWHFASEPGEEIRF
jgi:hypothetical protein